uniref:A kinase (PRKA) anchor protein 6 n=1 Tax=Acanthochromis polyacanthus TaxID=80966 RepID=A0A3Q1G2E0_9TELE
MSLDVLSPIAPEPPSPMLTSVTPVTPDTSTCPASISSAPLMDLEQPEDGASLSGSEPSRGSLSGGGTQEGRDASRRMKKPPPLHTGADWKVVLHLPEIEKWLKATSDRVTQLSHSVGQDGDNRHVDVHLVQLKDICEDISDHVEQIHALLETEFSLKLLSYSVNIIVDIRTVQLLWHQLRVSVLVLKERLLQGLQDSNGNFTRQTDILQAFSQDQHQTRLDALTEVDDCGQLTIRCSQDYFSLDCGITAFELSDYSPSDEPDAPGTQPRTQDAPGTQPRTQDDPQDPNQDLNQDPGVEESGSHLSNLHHSLPDLSTTAGSANQNHRVLPTMQCSSLSDSVKRPLQASSLGTEPSLPKRAALLPDSRGGSGEVSPVSGLQFQAELSRSTPSLMDPPDRSKFWLELDSVYPEHVSQSYESLQVMNSRNLRRHCVSSRHPEGSVQRLQPGRRSSSGAGPTAGAPPPLQDPKPEEGKPKQMESRRKETRSPSEESDSSASPVREQPPSDLEASGEDSDPRPPPKTEVWILKRHKGAQLSRTSPDRQHWFGSEEFLALPAQLRKTEMLALKLESLTQSIPLRPGDSALQDVDDWDLTELNWDLVDDVESSDNVPSPPPVLAPYRRNLLTRFSPSSSPLEGSIESGRLSELQSEEEEGRTDGRLTAPPVDGRGCSGLVQRLLEDIQSQDKEPDVWRKIERLVRQLDGFISWLQEALDSTENWTQPRQDLDSLRVYLDTHLSFKLNVDSHSVLKENIMEDGKELLAVITSNQSGLKEILQMVSSQWDQLQRQIRRQHSWMLRALRCIQARLFYSSQSHEPFATLGDPSANQKPPCSADGLKMELISSQCEAQRVALEQMSIRLSSLQYPSPTNRRQCSQVAQNNSLQEFEAEYQELWDWLMDMDAMVTDSHQLMMSEEQRHHLFKSSYTELMMMEGRKSSLLGRAESLKRSSIHLPSTFHCRIHNLTHTWNQLQEILSERSGPGSSQQNRRSNGNILPSGGRGGSVENPRSALSPLTNSLLEQLETRIKELKAWLRDTELLIFNSCLQDKDQSEQLLSFKSLCSEIRSRRRGISSVLKLCQKLLQQSQTGPMAEVGPEAEQHREDLQLLSINLERRWEAIVMQALQWQNRLRKQQQVPGSLLEPGLVDLRQISPISAGPVAPAPEDSWEWDDTDMTITESEPPEEPDLKQNLPSESNLPSDGAPTNSNQPAEVRTEDPANQCPEMESRTSRTVPQNNNIYQVFSLHQVELYRQPHFPQTSLNRTKSKRKLLLKSLSKDSSFSSIESLPDLLGGRGGDRTEESEGGRGSGRSTSRRSECESGIVSDTGDTETTTATEEEHLNDHRTEGQKKEKAWRREELRGETKGTREEEKRRRTRRGGEAVEVLINGRGILTPADSDSDFEVGEVSVESCRDVGQLPGLETPPAGRRRASSPALSQGSSLESLLALGVELFPSKDPLQRSASLESCLLPCRSADEETGGLGEQRGGHAGGEPERKKNPEAVPGEPSSGELSRRTLDLLKRLENIQSPLEAKMTRSVSDMTLRSTSPQRSRLPASPSLGGRQGLLSGAPSRRGPPSLINESSATASLTELSSTEDSSLGSEVFRTRRRVEEEPPNANSCRKRCHGNRGGADEADAASLSMVVNVSACTDEDEDDSDLLSSSTLTLTEEELGVRDEEDEEEERLSGASSANEDEDDEDEEEMEGSYVLGFEYMKRELQSWIRPPRTSSSFSRTEAGLRDELQCGTNLTSYSSQSNEQRCFLSGRLKDTRTEQRETEEENRRNATRSYISQFVDDVENGNVEQSCLKGRDEDELLREEASVFTKKGEPLREAFVYAGDVHLVAKQESDCELRPFASNRGSSLVGQLRGELPCHSSAQPSPPLLSPVDDCRSTSRTSAGRKAITIQEKFKFSSFVTEETKQQVRDKDSSPKPRRCLHPQTSCCFSSTPHGSKEDVHGFVMEIIDMTSVALKSKENQTEEPDQNVQEPSPASLAQIRDKVLEHAHRPLHLRKGDFYSYLSLSSHDSDCGEVIQCSEEKSSTPAPYSLPSSIHSPSPDLTGDSRTAVLDLDQTSPVPSLPPSPDIRDEETLFPACTEEVYLGPPLCYSMVLTKKARRLRRDGSDPGPVPGYNLPETGEALGYLTVHLDSSQEDFQASEEPQGPGSEPPASCGGERRGAVAVSRQQSGNPAPYLNPWARVGPIDSYRRSADTPALQSNNGAVMTQIRVRSAATNPPKEPPAGVNPQMKRRPMGGDKEEGQRGRKGRSLPLQDASQVNSAVNHTSRSSQGRSQASVRPPTSRTVTRPSMVASGASRIHL